jgi:hypothetical protein
MSGGGNPKGDRIWQRKVRQLWNTLNLLLDHPNLMKIPRLHSVNTTSFLIPTILTVFYLGIMSFLVSGARGQAIDDAWAPPVNLSQSGGATNPVMVIDDTGTMHVFWLDEYAGYFYRSGDGETWSERVRVVPPFDPYSPYLILGRDNRVHALWIDEDDDLFWSRARTDQLADSTSWTASQLIASSVIDFSVEVDEQYVVHVTYIYNEDEEGLSAGVGYMSSADNGSSWSEPTFLFQSPYIRGLEADNANIDVASSELEDGLRVYSGWGNRVRKQIFLARSLNGGSTWDEPFMVDGPDPTDPNSVPFNLQIAAFEEYALLVWQRGLPEVGCNVYYRMSGDGGNTWSERERMLEDFQNCPDEINFLGVGDGYVILQGTFPSQVIFQAWDGTKWSEPKLQSQLFSFEDSETFSVIDFECLQFAHNHINEGISVIGCDRAGGDVWFTSRNIGDTSTWYPSPPVWADPIAISVVANEIDTPILVGGQDEMMHAFWSQRSEGSSTNTPENSIYYARWDGEKWSRPTSILYSIEGSASQPYAVVDQNDHLLAVWSGSDSGQVYFSKAIASQALRTNDWTLPQPLPSPTFGARSPHILSIGTSNVFVTYAVPLNEARGIYLTISEDSGITWTEPLQVFDAAGAGWDMVDSPILARAEDGSLHAIFTRYSLPGGSGSLGFYYTRSEDGGETWTQADLVDPNPVNWNRIVSGRDGVLHRIWQARPPTSRGFLILHQYSLDLGYNWSPSETIANLGLADPGVIASLAVGSTNVMHLLHPVKTPSGEFSLNHWVWSGDRWVRREDLILDMNQVKGLNSLSAAASPTGRISVIFFAPSAIESSQNVSETVLLFSIRAVDISILPAAPLPPLPPPPTPTLTPGAAFEPTMAPTPTIDLPALIGEGPPNQITSRWISLGVGLSLAGILVVFALSVVVAKRRR